VTRSIPIGKNLAQRIACRVDGMISGQITAFFLFDVAEAIDLGGVQRAVGAGVKARPAPKPTTPPYVQYRARGWNRLLNNPFPSPLQHRHVVDDPRRVPSFLRPIGVADTRGRIRCDSLHG
jgi:hypothetical protein